MFTILWYNEKIKLTRTDCERCGDVPENSFRCAADGFHGIMLRRTCKEQLVNLCTAK